MSPREGTFVERVLNRLLEHKTIVNCDRDPYLLRWYVIRSAAVGFFIHKFVRSDEDRALHDHPWSFLVIPIWRGYVEHSECDCDICRDYLIKMFGPFARKRRVWPIIGARVRPATYRHRVELIDGKPSWSLFFRFRKVREWGFWPKEGFTLWNKWWQDKCE